MECRGCKARVLCANDGHPDRGTLRQAGPNGCPMGAGNGGRCSVYLFLLLLDTWNGENGITTSRDQVAEINGEAVDDVAVSGSRLRTSRVSGTSAHSEVEFLYEGLVAQRETRT